MDTLLRLSHRPPVVVGRDDTVHQAVQLMSKNRVGAVGVVEGEKLVGVFTERDLMQRVVLPLLDAKATRIAEVMTAPVETIHAGDSPELALERMVQRHIRHLAVIDDSDHILGMLSVRHLLQDQLERARNAADSLEAYLSADGPGG